MEKSTIAERYTDGDFSADVDFNEDVLTICIDGHVVVIPNDIVMELSRFLRKVAGAAGL